MFEMEPAQQAPVKMFIEALHGHDYLAIASVALLACVVAPIAEEVLFRGILHRWLAHRFNVVVGTIVSSIAFGAIHMNLASLVPLTLLGVIFSCLYQRTGNLWTTIFMHAVYNGAMLTVQILVFLVQ